MAAALVMATGMLVVVVESDDRSFQECQILKYRRLSRSTYRDSPTMLPRALRFTYNPFAALLSLVPRLIFYVHPLITPVLLPLSSICTYRRLSYFLS